MIELKKISEGISVNGAAWFIEFETLSKQKYVWQGEFENKGASIFLDSGGGDEEDKKNKPKIVFEKLFLNKRELGIIFRHNFQNTHLVC
ncbi:MAG: hypothetical protein EAZ08_14085 [Cytophagales bacterium]|nr:MAG: hypothetical protein EAZ08_14085 [Cytophagales bacterium]